MEATQLQGDCPESPVVNKLPLPEVLKPPCGGTVNDADGWAAAARCWRDLVVDTLYGGMPPAPEAIEIETLCHSHVRSLAGQPHHWIYRVTCHGGRKPFAFTARLYLPCHPAPQALPVIVNGDACWQYLNEAILEEVMAAGHGLFYFNRTELAEDLGNSIVTDKRRRSGGLYAVYPELEFGAISAWAWGYHRIVDLIERLPMLDHGRIAVSGHSRGGKTTLLAGLADRRIAVVHDNASGLGGGALCRYVGSGGETLAILDAFPSWFGAKMRSCIGREEQAAFDQHCLLAAIAPRPLLLTYSTDDLWSNPKGMVLAAEAARTVYSLLGQPSAIAYHLRRGEHYHHHDDWRVLLDFLQVHWLGSPPKYPYNTHPYRLPALEVR